jgi:hypothetical protein
MMLAPSTADYTIMVASDEILAAVQAGKVFVRFHCGAHGKITKNINLILRLDGGVPVAYKRRIHLIRRGERAAAIPYVVFMTEMQIGGEV